MAPVFSCKIAHLPMQNLRYYLIALGLGYLIYLLNPILTPFIFSVILAYLANPLVNLFESLKIPRTRGVIIVFILIVFTMFILVLIILPIVGGQIGQLISNMPEYIKWFKEHVLQRLSDTFGLNIKWSLNSMLVILNDYVQDPQALLASFSKRIIGSANYILAFLTYLFLVPVITFYMLRDWPMMVEKVKVLIPRHKLNISQKLLKKCDIVLAGFLRGQLIVMLGLGLIYAIGLALLGLNTAISIGLVAGLISFVPYLGLIVGISLAGLLALLQFQDLWHPLGVVVVFTLAQMAEGMYLTPKFVGDRTGLHPVAVLFAILAGGQLFGFTGILLAIPIMAVINVFLSYFKNLYLDSPVYLGKDKA